jgi:hypothetical protein
MRPLWVTNAKVRRFCNQFRIQIGMPEHVPYHLTKYVLNMMQCHMNIYAYVYMLYIYYILIYIFIYLFIYLSIYLFIDLFIYLFIYLLPFNNSCKQECHVRSHIQCMFMGMSAGKCNLIAMHLYVCVLRHLCFQRHRNCICASCFFHASVRVWASTFVWIHLLAHLKLSARIFTSVSARLCLLIPFDSHIWVLRAFMGMLNGSPHLQHFLYGLLSHSQDFR